MCIGRSIKVIFGIKTLQWRKTLKSFCQALKRRISVVSLAKKVKCKTEKRRSSCVATGVTQGPAVRSPLLLRKFCNEKKKKNPKPPPPTIPVVFMSCLLSPFLFAGLQGETEAHPCVRNVLCQCARSGSPGVPERVHGEARTDPSPVHPVFNVKGI